MARAVYARVVPVCASCGRESDGDFTFCPYCGAALVTTLSPARERRKVVTVLFCDVAGSTSLGESVDPEALRSILHRYFERIKAIVDGHGGTVEKFVGDAVMAVFGIPVLHEDDALRAVRAASGILEALPELGVQARIGINTGEVVTGTEERLATGDAVNVASRLESAAVPGTVLLGEETARLVRGTVEVESVSPLELKGKAKPVPAYRLVAVGEALPRRLDTAMVGRERELRGLHEAFARARHDRSCQLFTILGVAGVGKSRLAAEFLSELDALVLHGRCISYGRGITYGPVIEVLKQLGDIPDDDAVGRPLRVLLGQSETPTTADEIAWAFRKLLEQSARERPLVCVLDDLHWGEERFLDLVEHVADLSRDAPILLLCISRPELLERRSNWGGGKWNTTTVLLEPLDAAETDRLLDVLGAEAGALRRRIAAAAEGNPLFLQEMVALVRDSGDGHVVVPPTIQALLAARLDQLDPTERQVLERGSVEGRVFHRSAIEALGGEDPGLSERLVSLVRKQLIRPDTSRLPGDDAYRFRHLLIRDAAYDALPKSVRADLHERMAHWHEGYGAPLVEVDEVVGHHLEQAARYRNELGQPDADLARRAGERIAAAGRRALWRGDDAAAAALLARGAELLRPTGVDVALELDLASVQPTPQQASTIAAAAAARALADGDKPGAAAARVVAAFHGMLTGHGSPDDLEALAVVAIPLLEQQSDHACLVHVWYAVGFGVANARGQYAEWARAAEQALSHARLAGQRPTHLYYLDLVLILGPTPADEALEQLDAVMPEGAHPHPQLLRCVLLAMLGRFDEAGSLASEASERQRELAPTLEDSSLMLAEIAGLEGDYEAAARQLGTFCDFLSEHGQHSMLSTFAPIYGRRLCAIGRFDEAEVQAGVGRELGEEHDIATQALWRQVQARVDAHRGRHAEAETLAREAVAITAMTDALTMQAAALEDLAEVLAAAGRTEEAIATLGEALERYERKRCVAAASLLVERRSRLIRGVEHAEAPHQ